MVTKLINIKRILFAILLLPALAHAAPFLVCDPAPVGEGVTSYKIVEGGVTTVTPAPLHHDLSAVTSGAHSITVAACRDDAVWGTLCSVTAPFVYTRPGNPGVPAGFKISAN